MAEKFGAWITMGGVPVDLLGGMVDAMINPPPGFKTKFTFEKADLKPRIESIKWFSHVGEVVTADLTMEMRPMPDWGDALEFCKSDAWARALLEARNQLTLYLSVHDTERYQHWNDVVARNRAEIVAPILQGKIIPFQMQHGLDEILVRSTSANLTGALMENSYIESGHSAFFSLELLRLFEAGHFPCGWEGKWPEGRLLVY